MIKKHNCTSCFGNTKGAQFQDEKYGKGYRVCNPDKSGAATCTVCGETVRDTSAAKIKTKG